MGNTDILGDEISTGWDRILIIETRRRAVDTVCARIYHVSSACGGAGCGLRECNIGGPIEAQQVEQLGHCRETGS